MAKIVQTAGRNALGEFAPEFAHYNDDVLFGENWNNQDIDVKTRSIITVVALMAQGITDSSLKFHLQNAKAHGVTQKEIAAIITHAAFYAGWPKGWAVFNLAKEVWEPGEGDLPYEDEAMRAHAKSMVFPIGQPNTAFAQYFIGNSYLAPVSTSQVGIFNVTFEPGCRNNWHIHHAKQGGGQILVCVAGRGYYQEEGKDAIEMKPATWSTSRPASSTGTVPRPTAGSAISQLKSPASRAPTNGSSPSATMSTASLPSTDGK